MTATSVKHNYLDGNVAARYDSARFTNLAGRWFDRLERSAIRNLLRSEISGPASVSVLDMACGTGRITRELATLGFQVTGGDYSDAMITQAAQRCAGFMPPVQFKRLDLDRLDLPDGSFDLVTCVRLFHHIDTAARAKALGELARVSRRWVFINTSYRNTYYQLRRWFKRRLGQGISASSASAAEIAGEASAAGLRLIRRRMVLPGVSEDCLLLFEKQQVGSSEVVRNHAEAVP